MYEVEVHNRLSDQHDLLLWAKSHNGVRCIVSGLRVASNYCMLNEDSDELTLISANTYFEGKVRDSNLHRQQNIINNRLGFLFDV